MLIAFVTHMTWAAVLCVDSSPLHTTPMGHFRHANQYVVAILYALGACLAMLPMVHKWFDGVVSAFAFTVLQQYLMIACLATCLTAVFTGKYPDGYVPDSHGNPHLFIFCDQLVNMGLMFVHTIAIIDWCWWAPRRDVTC